MESFKLQSIHIYLFQNNFISKLFEQAITKQVMWNQILWQKQNNVFGYFGAPEQYVIE